MKTVTPKQLADAYDALHPEEARINAAHFANNGHPLSEAERQHPFAGWLQRYEQAPAFSVSRSNWYGKLTRALFHALNIQQPKTVKAMIAALQEVAA